MSLESPVEWHYSLTSSSQDPHSTLPHPLRNHRSSTFETPFAGYHLYFSYASFSDINCRLHQSLSCVPWRETERARTMERTHAENNLVALQESVCVCACVFDKHTYIWAEWVCVIFALERVCVCVYTHSFGWMYICACTHLCVHRVCELLRVCVYVHGTG